MIFVEMGGRRWPALGFGTWALSGDTCERATAAALEIGYRHIDTAQAYSNEAEVGRAIAASGIKRAELCVTTKIWQESLAPARLRHAVEASLGRLGLDHVDLLLIHWPNAAIPIGDTLHEMTKVQEAGMAKAIGISNFTVALMREAAALRQIACNQVEYHPLLKQDGVMATARELGMAITAYCPLARGELAGNATMARVAAKHGKTISQVSLRWLLEQQGVMAIPKSASAQHARENFAIFDFALDAEDRRAIDALRGGRRLVNPAWAPRWDAA